MDIYGIYIGLLALWLPLLWPLVRQTGWLRWWLVFVVLLGLAASLHEARMWFGSAEAIRVDILFIMPALAILYAVTAGLLFLKAWRRFALACGLLLAVVWAGEMYFRYQLDRENARFAQGQDLVSFAGFRSPDIYESHFGPFAPVAGRLPIGHWQAPPESYYRRLVINAEGELWLFGTNFRGASHESFEVLQYVSLERLQDVDQAGPAAWKAVLGEYFGLAFKNPVELRLREDGRLEMEFKGQRTVFAATPPPLAAAPAEAQLTFLGSFAQVTCGARTLGLVQLWLWRGEGALYSAMVRRSFPKGHDARFIRPQVLGRAAERDGTWIFDWQDRKAWQGELTFEGEDLIFRARAEGGSEETARLLKGQGPLGGDMIDLAPLTGGEDWLRWFDLVPLPSDLRGKIPAC